MSEDKQDARSDNPPPSSIKRWWIGVAVFVGGLLPVILFFPILEAFIGAIIVGEESALYVPPTGYVIAWLYYCRWSVVGVEADTGTGIYCDSAVDSGRMGINGH